MIRKETRLILYIISILILFYSLFSLTGLLPIENYSNPYAIDHPHSQNRYDYYVITDESGLLELMRVRITVSIGDEILAADNKLYEIIRIEQNHAYAKFIKQVKL